MRLPCTSPETANINHGFTIRAQYKIEEISYEDGTPLPRFMYDHAKRDAQWDLKHYLRVTLGIAGIEIKPEGPSALSEDFSTSWSAIALKEGSFKGVLKTELVIGDILTKKDVYIPVPNDVDLQITVAKPTPSWSFYGSIIATILSIATFITVLIGFIWNFRDRRKEAKGRLPTDEHAVAKLTEQNCSRSNNALRKTDKDPLASTDTN